MVRDPLGICHGPTWMSWTASWGMNIGTPGYSRRVSLQRQVEAVSSQQIPTKYFQKGHM